MLFLALQKKKKVIEFMKTLVKALIRNFEDDIRMLLSKPATPGMENRKAIVCRGT
jgi:hypothetical protein